MKVSVLMITYNHEHYITQAVASALAQRTTFDFEIVIGEDCSTDGTRGILLDLQRRWSRQIRLLLRDTNIGMNRNLVETLQECRGEYVALLEGDDYWTSPYKLQKQTDFLDRHPECAISFHATTISYEDGSQRPWKHPVGHQNPIITIEDLLDTTMQTCSVMFRNRLISEFPPWFYTLKMGDWPLHVLNAQRGDIGYIDEEMAVHRIHPAGAWLSQKPEWWMHERIRTLDVLNRHLGFRYERRARRVLSTYYYTLSYWYEHDGDLAQARRYLLRSITVRPWNKVILVRQLALMLKLYARWLYRPLRAAARYMFRA